MRNRVLCSRIFVSVAAMALAFAPVPAGVTSVTQTAGIESGISITAEAATAFPSLGTSAYCEYVAPKKMNVYKDSKLKTRGTCSPSKSYNSYVDKNDVLYLYELTSSYAKVSFPTSNGRREGFVARSDLNIASAPSNVSKATGKATTYVSPGGKSYGYFESGDQVYAVGTSGSYTATIYEAKSGKRRWKLGWVKTDDYNRYCKKSNNKIINLSTALYNNSGAYITCGFDGYTTRKKSEARHEGIDIKYKLNASIYALVDGTVINVISGSTGSNGLSQIAVYNSVKDVTVIYLHAKPSVKTGKKVSVGDRIGYESWRGVSSSGGSHTHVEVRSGRCLRAAKSLRDSRLDNSNPSPFWKSLGYAIK